jgi:hypothetical protein
MARMIYAAMALAAAIALAGCTQNVSGDMTSTCTPAGRGHVAIGLVALPTEASAHTITSVTVNLSLANGKEKDGAVLKMPPGSIVQPGGSPGFTDLAVVPARAVEKCTITAVTSEV